MKNDIDPRTVYSLSMTVILYELYGFDFFKGQESLIPLLNLLKSIILVLLIGQVVFLLMKGLLLAGVNDCGQKKLLELSDGIYAYSFQISIIFFIIGVFLISTAKIFDFFFNNPIVFWAKIVFILMNLGMVVGSVYVWRQFFQNNNQRINQAIYLGVILWSIFMTLIFLFLN